MKKKTIFYNIQTEQDFPIDQNYLEKLKKKKQPS